MSVQCKNCEWCFKLDGRCSLASNTRFKGTKGERVNINKQRVCAEFRRKKVE